MPPPIVSNKNNLGCAGKGGLTAFFGLFLAMGLAGAVVIAWSVGQTLDTWSWEPAVCKIAQSEITEGGYEEQDYTHTAEFEYTVEGTKRTSRSRVMSPDYSELLRRAHRYAPGSRHECHVDPDDPTRAVLEQQSVWHAALIVVPLLFAGLGLAGVRFATRLGLKPVREERAVTERPDAAPRAPGSLESWVVGGFFALFTAGGVLALVVMFVRPVAGVVRARGWTPADCTVVSSHVRSYEHEDSDGNRSTSYRADILYRYTLDGREYLANRVDFTDFSSSSGYDAKRKLVDDHPPGTQTACWVNPHDPYEAVLNREFTWPMLIGLIPGLFVLGGVAGWFAYRRSRRRRWERLTHDPADPRLPERFTPVPHELGVLGFLPPFTLAEGPYRLQPETSRWGRLFLVTFAALFWNSITWTFVIFLYTGGPRWALVPMSLFVLAGVGFIVGVAYQLLAMRNPRVTLTVSAVALRPGDTLRVNWRLDGNAARLDRLRITLEGDEAATYASGEDHTTDTHRFATLDLFDTTDPSQMPAGERELTIPRETMHSFQAIYNKLYWQLRVRGEIPRHPDLDESFAVTLLPLPVNPANPGERAPTPRHPVTRTGEVYPAAPLRIELDRSQTLYPPGAAVTGVVAWSLPAAPESLELRLLWFTQGKGKREAEIVEKIEVPHPAPSGERAFAFRLPPGPRSYTGTLVSICWAVELVTLPDEQAERVSLTVSPL